MQNKNEKKNLQQNIVLCIGQPLFTSLFVVIVEDPKCCCCCWLLHLFSSVSFMLFLSSIKLCKQWKLHLHIYFIEMAKKKKNSNPRNFILSLGLHGTFKQTYTTYVCIIYKAFMLQKLYVLYCCIHTYIILFYIIYIQKLQLQHKTTTK